MKTVLIGVAAIVLVIAIYTLAGRGESLETGNAPAAPPRRPVSVTQFSPHRRDPEPFPIAESAGVDQVADAVDGGQPSSAKPAPSFQEVRDRFEVFFASEAVDSSWNWKAADTLTKGIQAVLPAGSVLRRIECRGTLCRVETSHLDVDTYRTYTQDAFLNRETRVGSSGFFASLLGDSTVGGSVVAVAYLAREGKALPGPEALLTAQ
jgi:hypothetical protein